MLDERRESLLIHRVEDCRFDVNDTTRSSHDESLSTFDHRIYQSFSYHINSTTNKVV